MVRECWTRGGTALHCCTALRDGSVLGSGVGVRCKNESMQVKVLGWRFATYCYATGRGTLSSRYPR